MRQDIPAGNQGKGCPLNLHQPDVPPEVLMDNLVEALDQLSKLLVANGRFLSSMYEDHKSGNPGLSQQSEQMALAWAEQTKEANKFMVKFAAQVGVTANG